MSDHWSDGLKAPSAYPHSTSPPIECIETHISWVFLTGEWAYKVKKPVRFGFVDFSTLELRRAACKEELRLNRRTAPQIYESVIPIVQTDSGITCGGEGEVIDFAVRMRQFPQEDLLLSRVIRGVCEPAVIDSLARSAAKLHTGADAATTPGEFGSSKGIQRALNDCLTTLARSGSVDPKVIPTLQEWSRVEGLRLESHFERRQSDGFVRECHGDLHLGNIVCIDEQAIPFDCIEFNPSLRWIDVISDIAFTVMDLRFRECPDLASRLLAEWLNETGDFGGLAAFQFYLIYRALVRAKVASLRMAQEGEEASKQIGCQVRAYLDLARRFIQPRRSRMILMHGVSGSGKSTVARRIATALEAVAIRSDVERKRLFGTKATHRDAGEAAADLYSRDATRRTYERLQTLARSLLGFGISVVVDATFLKRADRESFFALAREAGVPCLIAECVAPSSSLQSRIEARMRHGGDPSDATIDVLNAQLRLNEPLSESERQCRVSFPTDDPFLCDLAIQELLACE